MIGAQLLAVIGSLCGGKLMKDNQHSRNFFYGLLVSSLVPAVVVMALLCLSPDRVIIPTLPASIVALIVSLVASSVIGLPIALWLRSRERLAVFPLCVAGMTAGAIALGALNFYANYWPEMNDRSFALWAAWSSAKRSIVPGAVLGLLSSVGFCLGSGVKLHLRKSM